MIRKAVTCASITHFKENESFVYHGKLGAFQSDWHWHSKGQLMYAENGYMHIHIDGKTLLLPGWYCAWVPAGTMHQVWSNCADLYIRTIFLDTAVHYHPVFGQALVFPVSVLLREMICYTGQWHMQPTSSGCEQNFLKVLQQILPEEMAKPVNVCLPSTMHEPLLRVLEYIQLHLQEKVSIVSVAKAFGFSVRTLTRLFNAHLGMSFSVYMKVARIIKALELIEHGHTNVSQVAYEVGYESLSTFSNNFLEICGNRPIYFINKKRGIENTHLSSVKA